MLRKIFLIAVISTFFLTNIHFAAAAKSPESDRTQAEYFLKNGYKPKLAPSYKFPLSKQTLNACYFFSVKNIIRYKYDKVLNVAELEKKIGKDKTKISTVADINKFNKAAGVQEEKIRTIESFFKSLQKGEPLVVSYMLDAKDKNGKKIQIPHIVAAYSFDEKGIWVAETVSGKYKRISYDQVFENGKSKYNAMRKISISGK